MKKLILILLTLAFALPCRAENIKERIKNGETLNIAYGANSFQFGINEVYIMRGRHKTDGANTGDLFVVMAKDSQAWQIAYTDNDKQSPFMLSQPHTYEDSLVSFRFIAVKSQEKNEKALYVLCAERDLNTTLKSEIPILQNTLVDFSLYKLIYEDDFERYLLKAVNHEKTQRKYCNADWALFKELGLPLPKDGNEYDCSKLRRN